MSFLESCDYESRVNNLVNQINLLKNSPIKLTIDKRMKEFNELYNKDNNQWFSELCFCLLTANFTARGGIKIQKALGSSGFLNLSQEVLTQKLKSLGHRFYNRRSEFIVSARKHKNIKDIITSIEDKNEKRSWLFKNINGLGLKESSHFLRNVGYKDYAIVDRHIINLLCENQLIDSNKKSITKKTYLEIEKILEKFCKKTNLSQAELDLYLWFMKTGVILK